MNRFLQAIKNIRYWLKRTFQKESQHGVCCRRVYASVLELRLGHRKPNTHLCYLSHRLSEGKGTRCVSSPVLAHSRTDTHVFSLKPVLCLGLWPGWLRRLAYHSGLTYQPCSMAVIWLLSWWPGMNRGQCSSRCCNLLLNWIVDSHSVTLGFCWLLIQPQVSY